MSCYEDLIAIRTKYGYSEFDRSIKSMMRQRIEKGDRERRKPLSRSKRISLYVTQEGKCARCHDPFQIKYLTDDHIIPISKGGTDDFRNRRLICHGCNRKKSDADMVTDSKRTGDTILQQLPGADDDEDQRGNV